jgi:putative NADH-flavin reductase
MAPKKIFVLGATGPLGVYFSQEALRRGHSLVIFARNPSKLPKDVSEHTNVKVRCDRQFQQLIRLNTFHQILGGQITDEKLITSAIEGCDVVFSALGPNVSFSNIHVAPGTYTNLYRIIFKAMRKTGAKRLFVMGTPSIVTPKDKQPFTTKLLITALKVALNSVYTEVVATGKLLDDEAQDLDWTMYRVGNLSNDTGVTKAANNVGEGDWSLTTFRPDVATWLLDQIEKETPEYVHEKPALHSVKG